MSFTSGKGGAAASLLLLGLAACQTTDDAVRARLKPWIGRQVSEYVSERSLSPSSVFDTAEGRTYIFTRSSAAGSCGITVKAVPAPDGQAIIKEMSSTCGPSGL